MTTGPFLNENDGDYFQEGPDWTFSQNCSQTSCFTSLRALLEPVMEDNELPLSDVELIIRLNTIELVLLQHRIQVDFLDRLPPRVAYKGLLQLLDSPLDLPPHSDEMLHVDGCDSACESCFQLQYCNIAKQVLGTDWGLAVKQAGINPSWKAFLSRDLEDMG